MYGEDMYRYYIQPCNTEEIRDWGENGMNTLTERQTADKQR